jgi:hypothetical protein
MPSRFAGLETKMSASVDYMYGEALTLEPRAGGEYATTADPDRDGFEFVGVVDFKPHLGAQGGSKMNNFVPVAGDELHVSIKLAALPADRASWPKQGDTIILTERPDEPNLKISIVEPDGLGRLVCRCTRTPR